MLFSFMTKEVPTTENIMKLEKDIDESNKKANIKYKKLSEKLSGKTIGKVISKIPGMENLSMMAEYFSFNPMFKLVSIEGRILTIEVDDIIIDNIKNAELMGAGTYTKIVERVNKIFRIKLPGSEVNLDGMWKKIETAIEDNDIKVEKWLN